MAAKSKPSPGKFQTFSRHVAKMAVSVADCWIHFSIVVISLISLLMILSYSLSSRPRGCRIEKFHVSENKNILRDE